MYTIEILATGISLLGTALVCAGKPALVKYSMLVWIVGSILWFIIGYRENLMGLMITNVGFLLFEILGLYQWYKSDYTKTI